MGIPAIATDPKASIQPARQQPSPEALSGHKSGIPVSASDPVVGGLFGRGFLRPELGPLLPGCFGDAFPTSGTHLAPLRSRRFGSFDGRPPLSLACCDSPSGGGAGDALYNRPGRGRRHQRSGGTFSTKLISDLTARGLLPRLILDDLPVESDRRRHSPHCRLLDV
jgi:hypothetical protein